VNVVVMAAAVADYAPDRQATQKIAKHDDTLTLVLKRTPDILGDLGTRKRSSGRGPILVGFAAETGDVLARAQTKLRDKGVDLMVANDVSRSDAGFDVETNVVTLVTADGMEALPLQSKVDVASAIWDRVEQFVATATAGRSR
jgi:phosphopantothenoylcysteine decarboxylase/phosphopantothenate--cysteine ligase